MEVEFVKTVDGRKVEIADGDAYAGPGECCSRQHVNTNVTWVRISDVTDWIRSQHKSRVYTKRAIEKCETLGEVTTQVMLGSDY